MKLLILLAVIKMTTTAPQNYAAYNAYPQNYAISDEQLQTILKGLASQGFPVPAQNVRILRYENTYTSPTNYRYLYHLSDGSAVFEQGGLRNDGVFAKKGYYSYLLSDSLRHTVKYTADENGFRPEIGDGPGGIADIDFCTSAICG